MIFQYFHSYRLNALQRAQERSTPLLTIRTPMQTEAEVRAASKGIYGSTVSVSRPERRRVPGVAPVGSPAVMISVPLTSTCSTPTAPA